MGKIVFIFLFFTISLFSFQIDNNTTFTQILSTSKILKDYNNTSINDIKNKKFTTVKKDYLSYGYAPRFNIWIKFNLKNSTNKKIEKILEYDNPLISKIELYNYDNLKLIQKDGFFNLKSKKTVNPTFKIVLNPNENRNYLLKIIPHTTALNVGLNIWDKDAYYKHELKHQFILALFLGAVGIIIIYNFIIFLSTKNRSYLFYVLAFSGILLHHILYKGLGEIYFFSHDLNIWLIKHATFVVAIPLIFLAIFTKTVIDVKANSKLGKLLNIIIFFYILAILFIYFSNLEQYRGIISILFMLSLSIATFYRAFDNKQAKFLTIGYIAFLSSALFMYLSSAGIFNIFTYFPHYIEASLLIETTAFSLSLANRLKILQLELLNKKEEIIKAKSIKKQELEALVEQKTKELNIALKEKNELYNELKHRIDNSMQILIAILEKQKKFTSNKPSVVLDEFKNKIVAVKKSYDILNFSKDIKCIDMKKYIHILVEQIDGNILDKDIDFTIDANIHLPTKTAVYCVLILNEAVTNSYKYAFNNRTNGKIDIVLKKEEDRYIFIIKDNGSGFTNIKPNSFGLSFIKYVAKEQFKGNINILSNNGVEIKIDWKVANG